MLRVGKDLWVSKKSASKTGDKRRERDEERKERERIYLQFYERNTGFCCPEMY